MTSPRSHNNAAAALLATLLAGSPVHGAGVPPVAVSPLAAPFALGDVRLLDGPFKDGQDIAVKYLLSLEPNRFLADFRRDAGLVPKAKQYGGWESMGVCGHNGGHYLSACSLAYASTGDKRFLERVNYFVSELAECQRANGTGYVAGIPDGKRVYAEIAAGNIRSEGFSLNGCWVPNYTMHKIFAGLRDAYRHCDSKQALEVARGLADWFGKIHANLSEEQMQRILACEHGGLNETFADLYADTGEERYLKLARRFHHQAILDPLTRGEEILPGKHANTQIPKLVGLARLYEIAGNPDDRAAAGFFWDRVVNHHSYLTGGHCDHEHFGEPDKLNDRLSDDTTETCNVYNMLKLTEHVFGWNPDAAVADFYERALLNHIRGSQHPDGRVVYNLTLKPGGEKHYQSLYDSFTCCVGTGMENHVKYGEAIYFHDADGLWVNLFMPSELNWKERGLRVRQETKWPMGDTTTLAFSSATPQEFTLRLRHPQWAVNGVRVTVNGEVVPGDSKPSSYVEIRRTWKSGDRVEMKFPMSLRTEAMPDNPKRIGIFYGPTLLAAKLGAADESATAKSGEVPVVVVDGKPVSQWVKPVAISKLNFKTSGVGRPHDVELAPFFAIHDRRYTVFLDVFTAADWMRREAGILADREREARLKARTVDVLRTGEQQPEKDHNLQGEHTGSGDSGGRKWRHATDGGWFSFEMKVDPAMPGELQLTYWGGETGNRNFDILVDGRKIASQRLQQDKPGEFFDVIYPLPTELTRGRSAVTVRLQAQPGAWAGGLFGAKTLRRETP
ncbi:MAG: glycoside hydrolase family 127 protein [Akkermansiaceae bacterium]|nr:glycoside hydrolase family 127 protein [Akkermansiaceae bacterium]MCF7730088.1 glycoside hydrolase family 127 protein [Akkermansiaceae bacterium]